MDVRTEKIIRLTVARLSFGFGLAGISETTTVDEIDRMMEAMKELSIASYCYAKTMPLQACQDYINDAIDNQMKPRIAYLKTLLTPEIQDQAKYNYSKMLDSLVKIQGLVAVSYSFPSESNTHETRFVQSIGNTGFTPKLHMSGINGDQHDLKYRNLRREILSAYEKHVSNDFPLL